jgi:type I restriction enzyme S subunit
MMATWPVKRMDDLCEITSSKRIFAADYVSAGVPFYRGREITEKYKGNLDVSTELFITEEKFSEIKSKFGAPVAGDLLLTSVGTLGSVYVVKQSDRFYFKDGNLTWFRNFKGLNSQFLYYWIGSPQGKAELQKCMIGSSQSAYTIVLLKGMEIELPPLPTQQRIASILSAYDELIENSQRRIKTLESMARALYREWFVHFRFPGFENYPPIDSALGEIPLGWEVESFGNILVSMTGGDWGSEQPEDRDTEEVIVVRGTDFDEVAYGGQIRSPVRYIKSSSFLSRGLKVGDVIIENSINAKSRSVGTTLLVDRHVLKRLGHDAIAASFCKVLRLHDPKLAPLVHLRARHLREDARMEYFQNVAANGIANFQAQKFAKEEGLILPKDEAVRTKLIEPITLIFQRIGVAADQLSNLRRTRDLLLPRLLSGQINVDATP